MQSIGSNAQLLFQQETTFNQDPTPVAAKKLDFVSEAVKYSRALIENNLIRGDRNAPMPVRGNIVVNGAINTQLQAYQLGSMLKFALGACTDAAITLATYAASTAFTAGQIIKASNNYYYVCTTAGTSGTSAPTWTSYQTQGATVNDGTVVWTCAGTGNAPYSHTLTIGQTLPSFVLEKGFNDLGQYHHYNGCKVEKVTFTIKPDGFQTIAIDILGVKETVKTVPFSTNPIHLPYVPFDGFSMASITLNNTAIAYVTQLDLTLENNLEKNAYVLGGQGQLGEIPAGIVKATGKIKALFEDEAMYTLALNNTTCQLSIKYVQGTGCGTLGNESIQITVPEFIFSPDTPVIAGPKGLYVEMPFTFYYNTNALSTTLQIIINNTETAL